MNYRIEIESLSPYMQHRMIDSKLVDWEKRRGFILERPEVSKEDSERA